jgi:hypothetical protein
VRHTDHRERCARPAPPGSDAFIPIDGTDYEVRIETLQDGLQIGELSRVSIAIVTIRTPERTFRRWVFDNPNVPNRDLAMVDGPSGMHDDELELDTAIEMTYQPTTRPAPVTIIAGPGEQDLHMLLAITGREPSIRPSSVKWILWVGCVSAAGPLVRSSCLIISRSP